ncbi:MAG TPA: hypothetical protein VNL74_14265 [Methylococcus sp.]|jgi:hypothetical protein|nr:hypothetical protein [Methylococcus sp.]
MKKLISALGLIVISLVLGGCGNAPDTDKQHLAAPYEVPTL